MQLLCQCWSSSLETCSRCRGNTASLKHTCFERHVQQSYAATSPCSGVQTESGQGYDLDCSLFERLVTDGFPVATLQHQRRMRPSIARLIRNTIYPSLQVKSQPAFERFESLSCPALHTLLLHTVHAGYGHMMLCILACLVPLMLPL